VLQQEPKMFLDPPLTSSVATSASPSLEDFPGKYNFQMDIGQQAIESKCQQSYWQVFTVYIFIHNSNIIII
jgi:hypothetical protein